MKKGWMQRMNRVNILNIAIDNISGVELLEQLRYGGVVFTPNVDHLMRLQRDHGFYRAYRSATYRICDSQILMGMARWLGMPLQEKLSGSDFFGQFYRHYASDESVTMFLLGAAPGVAQTARECINETVGRPMAIAAHSPSYGFEKNEAECEAIVEAINRSGATVLAVGLGAPKQELWIAKYRSRLTSVRVIFAIGATLDFEAGHKQRSPQWISRMGLEWLFRLALEPQRLWKRYLLDDLPFFWLALQQKLGCYRAPGQHDRPVLSASSQRPRPHANRYLQPIGQLMQQAGLLSPHQVENVLREQYQHPERRFGEILHQRGWAAPETVEFFLKSRQSRRFGQHRLGDYLTAAALISEDQLQSLLSEQASVPLRLGELAIQRGWVQPATVHWFLTFMGDRAPALMAQSVSVPVAS